MGCSSQGWSARTIHQGAARVISMQRTIPTVVPRTKWILIFDFFCIENGAGRLAQEEDPQHFWFHFIRYFQDHHIYLVILFLCTECYEFLFAECCEVLACTIVFTYSELGSRCDDWNTVVCCRGSTCPLMQKYCSHPHVIKLIIVIIAKQWALIWKWPTSTSQVQQFHEKYRHWLFHHDKALPCRFG